MRREHRPKPSTLPDLLDYRGLVAPGVIMLKNGGLLAMFWYQGPDLNYSAPEEMERLSTLVSEAGTQCCGTNWQWQIDLIRRHAQGYLRTQDGVHPTVFLIDEERRRHYHSQGHFETLSTLAITYNPPPEIERKLSALFISGPKEHKPGWETVLANFERNIQQQEDMLGGVLRLNRMTDEDMYGWLHYCVTGLDHPLVPQSHVDADWTIGNQNFVPGFRPQMGEKHVRVISIDAYPQMTQPGSQDFLHELAIPFRWSTRIEFMDPPKAQKKIEVIQTHWNQKRHTVGQVATEASTHVESQFLNQDAVVMAYDANAAAAEASSGAVIYGYYTNTVIVMDEDVQVAERHRRDIEQQINRYGFGSRYEEANAVEALRGSWPGNRDQNVRRSPIHSLNYADLSPLTSIWGGLKTNPNQYFPKNTQPLMLTATTGQTPFALSLHVSDIGHTKIDGPTGSGKSFGLNMIGVQWPAHYPDPQVFIFDKGRSAFVLAHACGWPYYDIGNDATSFCPLANVDDEAERSWALGWLREILSLQGVEVTPERNEALWRALGLLGDSPVRSMTNFVATVQDLTLRAALQHYTLLGAAGSLLDAEHDSITDSRFMVFETEDLLTRGEQDSIPVFSYLSHRVERMCELGRQTAILVDEENFQSPHLNIEEWFRRMRKKNAAVVVTMHSGEDLKKSPFRSVISGACQTKIYLPNPEAKSDDIADIYRSMGVNEVQREMLASAPQKEFYFYKSPLGNRGFSFEAGPVARALIGAGGKEDIAHAREMIAQYGEAFVVPWLVERGCQVQAKEWQTYRDRQGETDEQKRRRYETAIWTNGAHNGVAVHHDSPRIHAAASN